jgi:periplasmic divalent cation tolerance protein
MNTAELISITTTFSSREAAEACGRRLVESRLAACVQVEGPITSLYRWQGTVETAVEWRCACKTTGEREAECVAAIVAAHEYDTPQIAVARLAGSPAYAAWIRESVTST